MTGKRFTTGTGLPDQVSIRDGNENVTRSASMSLIALQQRVLAYPDLCSAVPVRHERTSTSLPARLHQESGMSRLRLLIVLQEAIRIADMDTDTEMAQG